MALRVIIRVLITIAVFVPFFLHATGHLNWPFVDDMENVAYDARLLATMPRTTDSRIVIVDLDERSLAAEGQWPWRRDQIARLVDSLFAYYQVSVVGFDIVFPEADRRSGLDVLERLAAGPLRDEAGFQETFSQIRSGLETDRIFAESLKDRRTVLGYVFKRAAENTAAEIGALPDPAIRKSANTTNIDFLEADGFTANLAILQDAAYTGGFFDNETLDADGVFRRVPIVREYQGGLYESLALAVTRAYLGGERLDFDFSAGGQDNLHLDWLRIGKDFRIPVDEDLAALVPYRGPAFSFPYVSATDVISHTAPLYPLKDSIVLIGTSAHGLRDMRTTPVGKEYSGVEVHANIVSGILDQTVKHHPQYIVGIEIVTLIVLALLMTLISWRLPPVTGTLLTILVVTLLIAWSFVAWTRIDLVVPLAPPMLFAMGIFFLQMLFGFFVESRGKRQLSTLFGQYIPPELVEEMDRNPGSLSMETESRDMTVLFSDVRGFTSIAEGLAPRELSQLMNELLTPMTRVIHGHRGTIDKYMGDAIMAFWGAPLEDPDHARHALMAGLEMQKTVKQLNDEFSRRGWPEIRIGVGLNTGTMRVGNMGSEFRMAYTVLGDAVNLGSRLEGLTKQYGIDIAVGETTKNAVPDFAYLEIDRVRVKGKDRPEAIFEPLGPKDALDQATRGMLARHRVALERFRDFDWDSAEQEFFMLHQAFPQRQVFRIYLDRIAHFRLNPPDTEWSGVFRALTK